MPFVLQANASVYVNQNRDSAKENYNRRKQQHRESEFWVEYPSLR